MSGMLCIFALYYVSERELLFHCSVLSESLLMQRTRLPSLSLSPGACSNSMSIKSVFLSNHCILRHPLLFLHSIFPSIRVFSNKLALCIRWPNIGAPTSAPVLPTNIQGLFPFRLTGLISLLPKGLSLTDIFSLWGRCPASHAVFDITAPHHKDVCEMLF